jgi:hypothetical protein
MTTGIPNKPASTRIPAVVLSLALFAAVVLLSHSESHASVGDAGLVKAFEFSLVKSLAVTGMDDDDASKKFQPKSGGNVFSGIAHLHFLLGVLMLFLVVMMVFEESAKARALLTIPIVLLFYISKILFGVTQQDAFDSFLRRYK